MGILLETTAVIYLFFSEKYQDITLSFFPHCNLHIVMKITCTLHYPLPVNFFSTFFRVEDPY